MSLESKITVIGLLFVFIFISGFWLRRLGRPVNSLILNIHKLISLGNLVYIAVLISQLRKGSGMSAVEISATAASGVLFLVTIITGGLLSIARPMPAVIKALHLVAPFLTVISCAATIYLLA
jgi:hypothetical protein